MSIFRKNAKELKLSQLEHELKAAESSLKSAQKALLDGAQAFTLQEVHKSKSGIEEAHKRVHRLKLAISKQGAMK